MNSGKNLNIREKCTLSYKIATLTISIGIIIFYLKYASEPLLGWYSSREAQTAVTAYWIDFHHVFKSLFSYETPILGYPWSIPFEFPLFQVIAAGIHSITGLPVDQSGRYLSAFVYFCCFIPLYKIIKELQLDKEYFYISAILLLLSPFYLYWSRAFLIESTALLMGFLFLWTSTCFSQTGQFRWIFLTLFFGILCSLVKITTFPSFVLAALLVSVVISTDFFSKVGIKKCISEVLPLLLVLALCFIVVKLWTEHADALKGKNLIASALVSKNLQGWNFGAFAQRFSRVLWKNTILDRTIPNAIGSVFCLFPILVGVFLGNSKQKSFILLLLGLFLAPMLIFTNLHIVHDYYQYANSFWLVLCIACSLYVIKIRGYKLLFLPLFILVCCSNYIHFQQNYKRYILDINTSRNDTSNQKRLSVASGIRNSTPKETLIVIFGEDWGAEIPFYAERRAIMLSGWLTPEQTKSILENPQSYGGLVVSAVIVNNEDKKINKTIINDFLMKHQNLDEKKVVGAFDIYTTTHKSIN